MAKLTIDIPNELQAWVDEQVSAGVFPSAEECLLDALRLEQRLSGSDASGVTRAIEEGLADVVAGRVKDARVVIEEMLAGLKARA